MAQHRSFDQFRMSDEMWQRLESLLPEYPSSPKGGRPRANLRDIADAIFYRLRTGCQWKSIPPELAPGSTAHDYFQEWVDLEVFQKLWQIALQEYDELIGLDFEWQRLDGAMTKAPLGGEKTGKSPVDRGKQGTKRSLMTDADGVPVGLEADGANVHDKHLVEATIEHRQKMTPDASEDTKDHLCLDKGYDYEDIETMVEEVYQYTAHIRSRGEEHRECRKENGEQPRRWVVERTHGWLNRFRGILVRWEKKVTNHLGSLHLACAYFTFSRAGVFG